MSRSAKARKQSATMARSDALSLVRCAVTNAVHEKGHVEEERTTALSSVTGLAGQEVGT
jgi:hypothetical protein